MRILFTLLLGLSMVTGGPAAAQQSKNVRLLCNWNDVTNSPVNANNQHWSDVWGFTIKGKEYAVIGGTQGAHIIDIDACQERAYLGTITRNVIHRDYKTYKNYLYCVADEDARSALLVYDLSVLPDTPKLVYVSDRDTLDRVHNIFIDTAKARLYCGIITGLVTGQHSLGVYSLANPAAPELIALLDGFDKAHDVYARNDTAWCSTGQGGYVVLNAKALPANRLYGGLITYPYKGYNHSSWVGYDYIGVMADETFGLPVKVIDAKDPTDIKVLSTFSPRGLDTTSVPHNPYLLDHHALVAYYMDGLQIYDLSDPYHPFQAGYYDTYPDTTKRQNFAGAWGCYPYLPSRRVLVSDMQTGLYVFDVQQALSAGSASVKDLSVRVWPDPADKEIWLQLARKTSQPVQADIYDATGRLVLSASLPNANEQTRLSLPNGMATGLYLVQIRTEGQQYSARFIKR